MKHPKAVLTVVGLTLGGTVAFYTYTTYLQKFMVNTVGLPKEVVSWINFCRTTYIRRTSANCRAIIR